jgi:hypothetical protein
MENTDGTIHLRSGAERGSAHGWFRAAIEKSVQPYARGNGFAIPKAAYVVAARKAG